MAAVVHLAARLAHFATTDHLADRAGSRGAAPAADGRALCGRVGDVAPLALGRHEVRTGIARTFGATDVVAERGEAAVAAVRELTGGLGAHAVIEAVGTEQSMRTAVAIARDGGAVGYVGAPHGSDTGLNLRDMFDRNVSLRGGIAPVRTYIPELLPDVLDGTLDPSPVFDLTVGLDGVPGGYKAMDERTALKVLVRV